MARLLPIERETIILMNDKEKTAEITTCQPSMVRQMKKLWGEGERLTPKGMQDPTFRWEIPKSQVKLPRPKSKKRSEVAKERERKRALRKPV